MLRSFGYPHIQQYLTMPSKCPKMMGFVGRNVALVWLENVAQVSQEP